MIIPTDGIYAIVEDNGTFREWRFLTAGTEADGNNVWPQVVDAQPAFDPDLQYLTEGIPVVDAPLHVVHKTWVINTIDLDTSVHTKEFLNELFDLPPSPNANQIERNRIGELLRTAATSSLVNMELYVRMLEGADNDRNGVYKLRSPGVDKGFYFGLTGLATAANLTAGERSTLNARLKKYNLRRVL